MFIKRTLIALALLTACNQTPAALPCPEQTAPVQAPKTPHRVLSMYLEVYEPSPWGSCSKGNLNSEYTSLRFCDTTKVDIAANGVQYLLCSNYAGAGGPVKMFTLVDEGSRIVAKSVEDKVEWVLFLAEVDCLIYARSDAGQKARSNQHNIAVQECKRAQKADQILADKALRRIEATAKEEGREVTTREKMGALPVHRHCPDEDD